MKKQFIKIGDILPVILNQPAPSKRSETMEKIEKMWPRLDNLLVKHSRPVKYVNKTVIVKADNELWKKEFENNKETIVLKLRTFLHGVTVENVEFI